MIQLTLDSFIEQDDSLPIVEPSSPRRRRLRRFLLAGVVSLVVLLVCIVVAPFAIIFILAQGNPEPIYTDFTPDPELAASYEQRLSLSLAELDTPGEMFTLSFSDDEFASYLDFRYNAASDSEIEQIEIIENLPFAFEELDNIQVEFENGRITLFAELVVSEQLQLGMLMKATVEPNDRGRLTVSVNSARVGSAEVPDDLRNDLARPLRDALTEKIELTTDYEIDLITVDQGELTIIGHTR